MNVMMAIRLSQLENTKNLDPYNISIIITLIHVSLNLHAGFDAVDNSQEGVAVSPAFSKVMYLYSKFACHLF